MVTPRQQARVSVAVCHAHPETGELWRKEVLAPRHQNVGWAVNASGVDVVCPTWREEARLVVDGRRARPDMPLVEGMVVYVGIMADREMVKRFRHALRDLP